MGNWYSSVVNQIASPRRNFLPFANVLLFLLVTQASTFLFRNLGSFRKLLEYLYNSIAMCPGCVVYYIASLVAFICINSATVQFILLVFQIVFVVSLFDGIYRIKMIIAGQAPGTYVDSDLAMALYFVGVFSTVITWLILRIARKRARR